MALMTDLWHECSSPISDLRISSTVSMTKRLRNMSLSAGGISIVPHVAPDAGDHVQAALPAFAAAALFANLRSTAVSLL
jgi:hypothetical protein